MKKFIPLLLLLSLPLTMKAQTAGDSIDKVEYRINYATKTVPDTTAADSVGNFYVYEDDEMRLDIGTHSSKFYSARTAVYDKWLKSQVDKGNTNFTNQEGVPTSPTVDWVVYRNYSEGETSFLGNAVVMNTYRISEKTVTPNWTIGTDTLTILGYHCTKAETDFKGRHWTAWYSEDIPLDYGPWKLIGLPGLILKAEDATHQFIFTASGMEQIGGKEAIALPKDYKKYEAVTQKQFDKINRTTSPNESLAASGIKISFDNGSDADGKFESQFNKPLPYNPIEIIK